MDEVERSETTTEPAPEQTEEEEHSNETEKHEDLVDQLAEGTDTGESVSGQQIANEGGEERNEGPEMTTAENTSESLRDNDVGGDPPQDQQNDDTESLTTTTPLPSDTHKNPLFKHQRLEGLMAKRPKAEALQQQGVPMQLTRTRDRSMTMEAFNFFFGGKASKVVAEKSRLASQSNQATDASEPKGKEKEDFDDADNGEGSINTDEPNGNQSVSEESVLEERTTGTVEDKSARKKLLIITVGSRGDVQPYLALALAMIAAGWDVTIATHGRFQSFIEEHSRDIQFIPLHGDPSAVLSSPQFVRAFYEGDIMAQMRVMSEDTKAWMKSNIFRIWAAAKQFEPDLILTGMPNITEVLAVGQKLRTPVVVACTTPFYPTNEFPPATAMPNPLPLGFLNSFIHWASFKAIWAFISTDINNFRESLNLAPQSSYMFDAAPLLCMYSETLVPRPKDWPMDIVEITGYWDLKPRAEYEPPEGLVAFLTSGDAPVFMGFGSMPVKDPLELVLDFCKVLKRIKRRGLIQVNGASEQDKIADALAVHDHVYMLADVPHQWLFPRCSLIIHHGGAGTTAAALRAGVPSVIYPLLADQPFWASRVAKLGVSPPDVIPLRELTRVNLEAQILAASSEVVVKRAREVGEIMRDEPDGVSNAVMWLERYAASSFHPRNYGARTPATEDGLLAWMPDEGTSVCMGCSLSFTFFNRRHHCRLCGSIFCGDCVSKQRGLLNHSRSQTLPVCHQCNPYIRPAH